MYIKEIVSIPINFDKNTNISVNSKFGFTLVPNRLFGNLYQFRFEDIIGKFELNKISTDASFSKELTCDKNRKIFTCLNESVSQLFISANVEMKKANYEEVYYHLQISNVDMKMLEIYDYYERVIQLPRYENFKFNMFIKKIAEGKIEVEIENPFNLRIEGQSGNYIFRVKDTDIVDYRIQFIFQPSISKGTVHKAEKVESRPVSATPSPMTEKAIKFPKNLSFNEIMSVHSDIILWSSDDIRIPTYKRVLTQHSEYFERIFRCNCDEIFVTNRYVHHDADTISSALEFLYGNQEAIKGKEDKVWRFAEEYRIKILMKACFLHFKETLDEKSFCEFAQKFLDNAIKI